MSRRHAWLVAVAALIATGLALKTVRYGSAASGGPGPVERLQKALMDHNWVLIGEAEARAGGLYTRLVFLKEGCAAAIVLALLDGNAESAALVRQELGHDVMFVQGGRVVAEPGGMRRQLAGLLAGLGRIAGRKQVSLMPVLGVIMPSETEPIACRGLDVAAIGR
jgi:hypothetical protein